MAEFVNEEPTEKITDEIASMFDLKQKKKKKKKKVDEETPKSQEKDENTPAELNSSDCVSQEFVLDPATYSYADLLQRAVDFLHQHNPEYTEKRRHTMKPPQLMRGILIL
jgi:hypothetical protein